MLRSDLESGQGKTYEENNFDILVKWIWNDWLKVESKELNLNKVTNIMIFVEYNIKFNLTKVQQGEFHSSTFMFDTWRLRFVQFSLLR